MEKWHSYECMCIRMSISIPHNLHFYGKRLSLLAAKLTSSFIAVLQRPLAQLLPQMTQIHFDPWIGIACCPGEDSVVEIIQEVWAACRESAVLYLRTLVFLLRLGRQGTWELKLIYEHVCKSCYLTETFLSAYKH